MFMTTQFHGEWQLPSGSHKHQCVDLWIGDLGDYQFFNVGIIPLLEINMDILTIGWWSPSRQSFHQQWYPFIAYSKHWCASYIFPFIIETISPPTVVLV